MGRPRGNKRRARRARRTSVNGAHRASFAIEVGDDLPTEFRIFTVGWNDSENGRVLFDDKAAAATMAAFERHGVDRMIDLEHLSLDQESNSFDPDARGWARLELRDGELWAVDVKWTADGARRLQDKTQRFISPTFFFDDAKRVTKILNIALTAMPATHDIAPLVAARAPTGVEPLNVQANKMTPEQASAALEAVKAGDGDAALALLEVLVTSLIGGGDDMPEDEEAPAEGEELPAEAADEEHDKDPCSSADDEEPEELAEVMASTARLTRLTGKPTISEAVTETELWRASHIELETERKRLAKERAVLEFSERKRIAKAMQDLGVATPATTGLNTFADGGKRELSWRFANQPLESLRADLKSHQLGGSKSATSTSNSVTAPAGANKNPFGLTDSQLAICKDTGCEPETFAKLNARGQETN